jgi:TonB-dependent receptor-like protein
VLGRLDRLDHGAPSTLDMNQRYLGVFGQDSWRVGERVTLNYGLRWEPYFGQNLRNGAVSNFSLENFRNGVRSQVYANAPVGLLFPGDPGVSTKGIDTQWWNLSPRAGVAWDMSGDGRTAIRSSYAMNYDLPTGQFMYRLATGTPFSSRNNIDGQLLLEDPYRGYPGGQIHPIPQPARADAPFAAYSSFVTIDPDINSTRVQSWNVTVERQLGASNLVSASYLGSYIDRIWGQVPLNPGVFMGLGPCTIQGVAYPTCTSSTNLHQRRVLSLENPVAGLGLGAVSRIAAEGQQSYKGVRLSFRHRAGTGFGFDGNYTISKCEADTYYSGGFFNFDDGYQLPDDPSFDRGNCVQNRTHIGNVSLTYQTPRFASRVLGALASDWRVAGVVNARSGQWLTVLTNRDIAGTGILGSTTTEWIQRVNQVSDTVYGADPVNNFLNRDAFAFPQPGTLGNHRKNSIEGPHFWSVDMALSRQVSFGGTRSVQLRVEVFNLLNTFNLGLPATVLDLATFGRITAMTGNPRLMQFGVKYGF